MRQRTVLLSGLVMALAGCPDRMSSAHAQRRHARGDGAVRSTTVAAAMVPPDAAGAPDASAPAPTPRSRCTPETIDPVALHAGDVSTAVPAHSNIREGVSVRVQGGRERHGYGGFPERAGITAVWRDGEYSVVALSDGREVRFRIPAALFPLREGMEIRIDAGTEGHGLRELSHAVVYDDRNRVLVAVVHGQAPEGWTITTRLASATRTPDTEQCERMIRYHAVVFEHAGRTAVVPPGTWRRLTTPDGTYHLTAQSWDTDYVAQAPPSETVTGENTWAIVRRRGR